MLFRSENGALKAVLFDVLDTPVSPELLPSAGGTTTQLTESILGSYELHDFYLYMTVRRGFSPRKTLYLAERAFAGRADRARLRGTLTTFLKRFFMNQFKRSCLPDGPKVGQRFSGAFRSKCGNRHKRRSCHSERN